MSSNAYTAKFMRKVPPSPVTQQIEALHAMAYWAGIQGSALEVFEYHLYSVSVFAHDRYRDGLPPWEREHLRIPDSAERRMHEWRPGPLTFPEATTPATMANLIKKVAAGMTAVIESIRDKQVRLAAPSQERVSERRYKARIENERKLGLAHVRAEAARVRRELGL